MQISPELRIMCVLCLALPARSHSQAASHQCSILVVFQVFAYVCTYNMYNM